MTTYDKFLRLPKQIKRKVNGFEFVYSIDIIFDSKYNDVCSIEYNRIDAFGDYVSAKDLYWNGTFEGVVEKVFAYFLKTNELLKPNEL